MPNASNSGRSRPPEATGANAGLTMIEAVVGFAILALGLGALLGGLGMGLRAEQRAKEASLALLYAESLLAETGSATPLETGKASGSLPGGYVWRRDINPLPLQNSLATPYRVSVSVTPPGNGAPVRLDALRLGQAPSTDSFHP